MKLGNIKRQGVYLCAALLVLFGLSIATARPAAAWTNGTKYYSIDNLHSWLCLDVVDWGSYEGANVQQWGCNWNWAQQWGLNPSWRKWAQGADGKWDYYYEVMSRANHRCLAVADRSKADGANVHVEDCDAGPNQYWAVYPYLGSTSTVTLRNLHSGKCLEVYGLSKGYGGNVVQWGCWYGPNQRWYMRPASY